jgi:signal transduction histidine kinase/ActR/RegA family two-component response regulator
MLGYRAADLIDQATPSDLHDPLEVIARANALSAELGTVISPGFGALAFKASRGIEDIYELTFICKDGSRFPAIVSITALRDDADAIIGYLLIGTHNSVRKQVEFELNDAMKVADQANLAKSEFLSSMSHELRTPLGAILGFAQLIESGVPPPTVSQRRSLEQILKAGWYLLDLINEILDLAMIESGKVSLSLEPIALSEVLREIQTMIEPQAAQRSIHISFPGTSVAYRLNADRTRVKQILINLLSNAVKYNRVGGVVTVSCSSPVPGRVRIAVADTGEGLSIAQLGELFQPFNRLGQKDRVHEGTGIGLVVSKRLVELMDGRIDVESKVGTGSIFTVELNLSKDTPHARAEGATELQDFPCTRVGAAQRALLYIEDNPANLMLVQDLIARRPDISLTSASDGSVGLEMARHSLPDLILMDINLPGISGLEVLRLLRRDPRTSRIPVVALSANASPRDVKHGIDAGFFRYLTKPIKVVEFMQTIDTALEAALPAPARAESGDADAHL